MQLRHSACQGNRIGLRSHERLDILISRADRGLLRKSTPGGSQEFSYRRSFRCLLARAIPPGGSYASKPTIRAPFTRVVATRHRGRESSTTSEKSTRTGESWSAYALRESSVDEITCQHACAHWGTSSATTTPHGACVQALLTPIADYVSSS